jgi:hypothetical protein
VASYDFVTAYNQLDIATDLLVPCKLTYRDTTSTSYLPTDTFSFSSRCSIFPDTDNKLCGPHRTIILHFMPTCSSSSTRITLPPFISNIAEHTSYITSSPTSTYASDHNDTIFGTS